jgi:hypothetical protein
MALFYHPKNLSSATEWGKSQISINSTDLTDIISFFFLEESFIIFIFSIGFDI